MTQKVQQNITWERVALILMGIAGFLIKLELSSRRTAEDKMLDSISSLKEDFATYKISIESLDKTHLLYYKDLAGQIQRLDRWTQGLSDRVRELEKGRKK